MQEVDFINYDQTMQITFRRYRGISTVFDEGIATLWAIEKHPMGFKCKTDTEFFAGVQIFDLLPIGSQMYKVHQTEVVGGVAGDEVYGAVLTLNS
jgi:hypothetical protein